VTLRTPSFLLLPSLKEGGKKEGGYNKVGRVGP